MSRAAESTHWYSRDGAPRYTVLGKNGKERPTTIRDARALELVPSVTTIINAAAKPNLINWMREQTLLAALTLPIKPGESEDDWIKRVRIDQDETRNKAAERGTAIHAAIEKAFREELVEEYVEQARGAYAAIKEWTGGDEVWAPERSFAFLEPKPHGGKVDLHSPGWVFDFKTKEFTRPTCPPVYDEHMMQLAAYRRGLGVPEARAGIVYVSATDPGWATVVELSEPELDRGLAMFDCLLEYWYHSTGLGG